MPSACEKCLGDNPYVQVLKEDFGAEWYVYPLEPRRSNSSLTKCSKICTRPFTVFRWKTDRTARQKRTNICLTCARLKNCCQCCMLDLSFGLPIVVRDAALKMITPGPNSEINREYYAQNHEKEIEEGRGAVEAYEKTDEKARELLRRLAQSEPHYKRQRRLEEEGASSGQKMLEGPSPASEGARPGPIRTKDSRPAGYGPPSRPGKGASRARPFPNTAVLPPQPQDILPPADKNVMSLFVTGVEDDLPEHEIRAHFAQYGALRSLVCSHRSHCAFVNYMTRDAAEAAAAGCQGRAVVKGVPLRVQWGKPKTLDNLDREARMANARAGRETVAAVKAASSTRPAITAGPSSSAAAGPSDDSDNFGLVAPPPGSEDVQYASLAGE